MTTEHMFVFHGPSIEGDLLREMHDYLVQRECRFFGPCGESYSSL